MAGQIELLTSPNQKKKIGWKTGAETGRVRATDRWRRSKGSHWRTKKVSD